MSRSRVDPRLLVSRFHELGFASKSRVLGVLGLITADDLLLPSSEMFELAFKRASERRQTQDLWDRVRAELRLPTIHVTNAPRRSAATAHGPRRRSRAPGGK